VIDFPRRDPATGKAVDQIRMQILDSSDHDRARLDATLSLKKRGLSDAELSTPAIKEVMGDAVAKELIAMSCRTVRGAGDPENPNYARVFRNAQDVDKLRADEILVLFNAYMLVQAKYGPFEQNLSETDVDAWIERLEEGASEFPLLELALPQLVTLAFSLAQRLSTLSRVLGSQLESLPTTLAADLGKYVLDTGSAGSPAEGDTPTTSAPSEPITLDRATELAKKMRERDRG
jgi:hypothetical protein